MISLGMVDVDDDAVLAEARDCDLERGGESPSGNSAVAGIFLEAAVDGFTSCAGDGSRLIETDWMAEASSEAGLLAILMGCKSGTAGTTERDRNRSNAGGGYLEEGVNSKKQDERSARQARSSQCQKWKGVALHVQLEGGEGKRGRNQKSEELH